MAVRVSIVSRPTWLVASSPGSCLGTPESVKAVSGVDPGGENARQRWPGAARLA